MDKGKERPFNRFQASEGRQREAAEKILGVCIELHLTQRELEGALDYMKQITHLSADKREL